jgi:hypothetical protein
MIGNQIEKHSEFMVVDQPDRQPPAGRLSRNEESSRRFQTHGRRKRPEAEMQLKPGYKWITTSPRNTEEFGSPPFVSEFADPKLLRRLITVCAWCNGTQNVDHSWRHAENDSQTDAQTAVTHGICPECAEKSYNEYRLAVLAVEPPLEQRRTSGGTGGILRLG